MTSARYLQITAWSLSFIVCLLAVLAWGQSYLWHISSSYQWFPLLGLLAFSLMWTHYISSVLRQRLGLERVVLAKYFEWTSWAVLVALFLHPGILIWQRFRDGYGLPPHSYESYVAPSMAWITLLGSVNLFIFLAYELRRLFGQRPWWKYMQQLTDLAMLGAFYHGLRLGGTIQLPWFKPIWYFYGLSLVGCLIYIYRAKFKSNKILS
ncbi:MAG TPA: hypothetical protein VLG37_05475 [Candidatus Saccharimonadales bacterium]|nr:hypothetical protein [Candidatus Saccharimonadales bacterium]